MYTLVLVQLYLGYVFSLRGVDIYRYNIMLHVAGMFYR